MSKPEEHVGSVDPSVARDGLVHRVGRTLERGRLPFQGGVDSLAWFAGLFTAVILRFDFAMTPEAWHSFTMTDVVVAGTLASAIQLIAGWFNGLYRGRFRYGSFDEVAHLVRSALVATVLLAAINHLLPEQLVPASVSFIGGFVALMTMAAVRYVWRLLLERSLRPSVDTSKRTLVFGAGEGGVQAITAMLRNPASPYLPVAMLDDNPSKSSLQVMGVRVVGTRHQLAEQAKRLDAQVMVVAIPSAGPELLRDLTALATDAGLEVAVLPPVTELFGSPIGVSDIRPITEADLLGRHEINTDIEAIAGYLTGRRVLVTGAGGSIGSELCRQLARFAPSELIMLDRDESALHGVQMLIEGRAMLDSRNLVVCDIRDRERLTSVFDEHQPEVVFHAAALKHLPLLQMHPSEALKTNVFGTVNLLEVAREHRIDRFVNISTDKAADPTSVLGFSKRVAERLTAGVAHRSPGCYLSVRFGNVLGSRGSVLTAFKAQVEAGGPLTVTHREVTRYFMTVEEAVQLVIQAGAVGGDGEALVLDMGEPVLIDDVARRLATHAERKIDIVYTGLRQGEKVHEVLLGEGEIDRRPSHPLISHVAVPELDPVTVQQSTAGLDDEDLIIELSRLAYAPPDEVADQRSLADGLSTDPDPGTN